jgi:hypothetical protein
VACIRRERTAASAHTPPGIAKYNEDVTGPFAGTAFFEFSANGCSFVYVQLDGTYTSSSGTGTLHIAGCADSADVVGGFEFIGLFTIVTPAGATVSGTARGPVFPLDFTFSVAPNPGNGPFSAIGGTIDFTASSVSGDITGALSGALQPAVHQHPERPTTGAINKTVSGSFTGSAFFSFVRTAAPLRTSSSMGRTRRAQELRELCMARAARTSPTSRAASCSSVPTRW